MSIGPRAFRPNALAAHLPLDHKYLRQKLLGHQLGLQRHRAVQEPGLVCEFHRLGFIERRHRDHFPQVPQLLDRGRQLGNAIAEVRAQGKIDGFLHAGILDQFRQQELRSAPGSSFTHEEPKPIISLQL